MTMGIPELRAVLDRMGIEYRFSGDESVRVDGFSALNRYSAGTLTWIGRPDAIPKDLDARGIALAVVQSGISCGARNVIETDNSKLAFFSLVENCFPTETALPARGSNTYIGEGVKLGEGVRIGHNCVIDGDIEIGDGTCIWNNVSIINKVRIGRRCVIQSGVSIGHDGFGYAETQDGVKQMIKHHGGVVIGDDVSIFANTCVARGTINDTVIGDGCKIDTLVHIGHNACLGKNVSVVSNTMLGGSVRIEDGAYISTSEVRNQIRIGKKAFVGLGSTVVKDVEDEVTVAGCPAKIFERERKD